jgi:type II restriction enzyme
MEYEEDAQKIFSNTEIKGGVAITYHDVTKSYHPINVFTKYPELNSIVSKASPENDKNSLMSVIYIQNKFDLDVMYADYPEIKECIGSDGKDKRFRNNIFEKVKLFTDDKQSENDIEVIGVINNKRQWRYINSKYVDLEHENINKWKVLVVRVNGKGVLGEVLSTPIIAHPMQAYTQTFIGIGACENESEASNILKYVKSKFARTMLSVLKVTQDNNRDTWKYVPLQDFTDKSDINWSTSISNIDMQLYKKYNLSDEEIDFIETNVKEMD